MYTSYTSLHVLYVYTVLVCKLIFNLYLYIYCIYIYTVNKTQSLNFCPLPQTRSMKASRALLAYEANHLTALKCDLLTSC